MAQTFDFTVTQGDTFLATLNAKNEDGSPIDLTNHAIKSYLRNRYSDSNYLIDLNPTIFSAPSGVIHLDLTAAQTASLPVTEAVYDIEIYTSGSSNVTRLVEGKITILPQVI